MEKEKKKKKSKFLVALKKRFTPQTILLLILLLVSNSFAWFVYSTEVSSSVDVHVKAWKVEFKNAETPIDEYVNISVGTAFPGMDDFSQVITAYNESEVEAELDYVIMSVNLMGTSIKTVEGVTAEGGTLTGSEPTSDELATQLTTNYPFIIRVTQSSDTVASGSGTASFTFSMTWPYESGKDTLDTYWGTQAYNYKTTNPTSPSIAMVVKIRMTQAAT